jgi:D-threonate/D-erythronate kinase
VIGVIADDISGAAELGAVGLRHGLRAEIIFGGEISGQSDLVCVDTDSRSCAPEEAKQRVATAAALLTAAGARWIYKKIDSVLRGHVLAEVEALLAQLRLNSALVVPANPSLGRVIRQGCYFIHGRPIHETEFAQDPEYPRNASEVRILLQRPNAPAPAVCRLRDPLPNSGVVIGEAESTADLRAWTARLHHGMLAGGAAEFFAATLAAREKLALSPPQPVSASTRKARELFVCGSTSESAREFIHEARGRKVPAFSLPSELVHGAGFSPAAVEVLAGRVIGAFQNERRVILHIGLPPVREPAIARRLTFQLVQVAGRVLEQVKIGQVYAEGGATAVALIKRMQWGCLKVIREMAPGVATLQVKEDASFQITVKPGSYVWPSELRMAGEPSI